MNSVGRLDNAPRCEAPENAEPILGAESPDVIINFRLSPVSFIFFESKKGNATPDGTATFVEKFGINAFV